MNCCQSYLGKHPHQIASIPTGVNAAIAGDFVFLLKFADQVVSRTANFALGVELEIPGGFNEDYRYTVEILDPNNDPVLLDDCPNFVFDIYINLNPLDCGDDCDN